jgi:hypothetical protein
LERDVVTLKAERIKILNVYDDVDDDDDDDDHSTSSSLFVL